MTKLHIALIVTVVAVLGGAFAVRRARTPPHFTELHFRGTIVRSESRDFTCGPPDTDDGHPRWDVAVVPAAKLGSNCRVWLKEQSVEVHLYDHTGHCDFAKGSPVRFHDDMPTAKDGDAIMDLDVPARTLTMRDTMTNGTERWRVTLHLD